MRPRLLALMSAVATAAAVVPAAALPGASASGPLRLARDAAPVVLTGAQIAAWAAPAAEGLAATYPSGASKDNPIGDELRSAHNGTLVVPPTPPGVTQVDPDTVAAYAWDGTAWTQIPVQVDQRFPDFLANGRSDFGFYSEDDTPPEPGQYVYQATYDGDTNHTGSTASASLTVTSPEEIAFDSDRTGVFHRMSQRVRARRATAV